MRQRTGTAILRRMRDVLPGFELTRARMAAIACAVGQVWSASAAGADTAPIVAWSAPSQCPSAETVLQRLSSLVDSGALGSMSRAGEVRGEIHRGREGSWVLSLLISEGKEPAASPRRLSAAECDDLADAAAVAIALALGGNGAADTSAGGRNAAGSAAARAGQPSAAATPRASESPLDAPAGDELAGGRAKARGAEGPALALSGDAIMDLASLGGAAFGGSVQAQARLGALGLGVYGLWLAPRENAVAPGQHVEFSLLAAGVRACYRANERAVEVDVCGGFELDSLQALSVGLLGARNRRDTWLAPTWGAELGWRLTGGLRIEARLEALLPLSQEEYVVDVDQLVHRVPGATARLALGLVGNFSLF